MTDEERTEEEKREEPIVIEPEELKVEEEPTGEEEGERLIVEVGPEEEVPTHLPAEFSPPPSFKPVIWREPLFSKLAGGVAGGLLGTALGFLLLGTSGGGAGVASLALLSALVGAIVTTFEGLSLSLKGSDFGRLAVMAFVMGLAGGGLGGLTLWLLEERKGISFFLGHLGAFWLSGCGVGLGTRRRASASLLRWGAFGGLFGLLCGAWAWICKAFLEGALEWALIALPFGLVVPGGLGLMERLVALMEVRCLSGPLAGARQFVDTGKAMSGPDPRADLPSGTGASVEFEVMPSGLVARPLSGEVEISGGDPGRRAVKVGGVWIEAVLKAL